MIQKLSRSVRCRRQVVAPAIFICIFYLINAGRIFVPCVVLLSFPRENPQDCSTGCVTNRVRFERCLRSIARTTLFVIELIVIRIVKWSNCSTIKDAIYKRYGTQQSDKTSCRVLFSSNPDQSLPHIFQATSSSREFDKSSLLGGSPKLLVLRSAHTVSESHLPRFLATSVAENIAMFHKDVMRASDLPESLE